MFLAFVCLKTHIYQYAEIYIADTYTETTGDDNDKEANKNSILDQIRLDYGSDQISLRQIRLDNFRLRVMTMTRKLTRIVNALCLQIRLDQISRLDEIILRYTDQEGERMIDV